MNRILQLETHNQQLKNIIKKELVNANNDLDDIDDNNQRKFDFAK